MDLEKEKEKKIIKTIEFLILFSCSEHDSFFLIWLGLVI
jgi:hypothetical protein